MLKLWFIWWNRIDHDDGKSLRYVFQQELFNCPDTQQTRELSSMRSNAMWFGLPPRDPAKL